MTRVLVAVALWTHVACLCFAQEAPTSPPNSANQETETVRGVIKNYVETFNKHDATAVAKFWTENAVSVDDETGQRSIGRETLQAEFEDFFAEYPNARLSGIIDHLHGIGSQVVIAEGSVRLVTDADEMTESAFTAVFEKRGDKWLIASSHEHDIPAPPDSYEALKELEWLVGSWQDQTDGVAVSTSVRWSTNRAFLIRSFLATLDEDESFEGTQVIGWDPQANQIRTWTFHSDGSFGDGTASKNGEDWIVKMTHVLNDGQLATGTQVITRIDDNTMEIQKIGETIEGQPIPASDPITVSRVTEDDTAQPADAAANSEGEGR